MYGKIFESIYDGTLVEDWRALITFQQFIVLCDADGIVDMTPSAISRRTGIPIEHIKAGIEILENPDPYSRTPSEEGRRILRIDDHRPWGWQIVNHAMYKALRDAETVREQTRERVRNYRQKQKEAVTDGNAATVTVTDGNACNAKKRYTDTDTDIKKNMSKSDDLDDFENFWKIYPRKENKKKSLISWKKINAKTKQIIFDDLKTRYSNTPKQFIPLPTSYLNGERWNDEVRNQETETLMYE